MITLRAQAKINWFLRVLGRRDDGYHEISSLMLRVSLADSLTFAPADRLSIQTDADIPEQQNIVYRAADLLRREAGITTGARIGLIKRIPSPAGLGGGSSDAASTLIGLSVLWGLSPSAEDLHHMASTLGSDVPYFLGPPAAVVLGRGEEVVPMGQGPALALVLAKPPIGVPTPWAYAQLKHYSAHAPSADDVARALASGNMARLLALMGNDLEPPVSATYPQVRALQQRMTALGASASAMSGSGPTVFGVFGSTREAEAAARELLGGDSTDLWAEAVTSGTDTTSA